MVAIRRWQTWAFSLLCWTLYAIFDSAGSYAYIAWAGSTPNLRDVVVWNFCYAYSWVLATPLIYEIALRYNFNRDAWRRSLAVHVVASLLITVAVSCLFIGWNTLIGLADTAMPFKVRLLDLGLENLPRCFATMGVAHAIAYYARWQERETESVRLEGRLAQAQLEILRSQFEPHFLFNTLNSIATLIRKDPVSAERMTLQLATLLRASLECIGTQEIPLEQELGFLRNYLKIQQTRFGDRLTVNWNVDPTVLPARVPSMILQPLVENAIRHGIAESAALGRIEIRAASDHGSLSIEISDNGPGFTGRNREERNGFGLRNTKARLRELYGEHHRFELRCNPGEGCTVTLAVPLRNAISAGQSPSLRGSGALASEVD